MRKSLIVLLWPDLERTWLPACLLLPVFAPNRILGVPHGVVGGDVVLSLRLNRGQQFFVRDQTQQKDHMIFKLVPIILHIRYIAKLPQISGGASLSIPSAHAPNYKITPRL